MRINKYLAAAGVASRRKAEKIILDGEIKVNNQVVTDLAFKINQGDKVTYKGKTLSLFTEAVYIMLNKPKCYISAVSDNRGRKTVVDLIKEKQHRVFPVGRLDYNTEGLMLLTNDGDFANKAIHPSSNIGKTYEVITKQKLSHKDRAQLKTGILINDVKTYPAEVSASEKIDDEFYRTSLTIFEGKNRIIRNMFKELQIKIYNLKRTQIGNLQLGNLSAGKYVYLTKNQIDKIFN